MEIVVLALSFPSLSQLLNYLLVAVGLGTVVFIHELGHFVVARLCGVRVERFSIGFGPLLLRFQRGDTEYALSAIPLGGYVKMLGQDDADPQQLTDADLQKNPRSYTAKSVPQRMAIISAGVIMNLITAAIFFVVAFLIGVHYGPAVIGNVTPGGPAWKAGIRQGDRLTRVGGFSDRQLRFTDLMQAVALSHGDVVVEGLRNSAAFRTVVSPRLPTGKNGEYLPRIYISPLYSLRLWDEVEESLGGKPATMGTPASESNLQPGDEITQVAGKPVETYDEFFRLIAAERARPVRLTVRRTPKKGDELTTATESVVEVSAAAFRSIGIWMDVGRISAIQPGSPGEKAGLKAGDKFTHIIIDGKEKVIGTEFDAMRLPEYFSDHAGEPVRIKIRRDGTQVEPIVLELTLLPEARPAWSEVPTPDVDDVPISIPAIGVAFHMLNHVSHVEPGSAADGVIQPGDGLQSVSYVIPEELKKPGPDGKTPPVDANRSDVKIKFGEEARNWPVAFWMMQYMPRRDVRLNVVSKGQDKPREILLTPRPAADWFNPDRGFVFSSLSSIRKAENIGEAAQLGFRDTYSSITGMYVQLSSMFSGRIRPQALGGPITIARVASSFADRGVADLILFLGMLSVSLAVVNFLPIPVLDGGHFVFLLYEGIRGKPAPERVVVIATYVGLSMILSLMVWVFYRDIVSLVYLFSN